MADKKKYLFDTHVHTAEASPCANVRAKKVVREYKANGYDGIIITDHVGDWGFSTVKGNWRDKADRLVGAYEVAKRAGEREGMVVLFGMEVALNRPHRDYLVFGVAPGFLYKHENIQELSINELHEMTQNENALLLAAHPFRGMRQMPEVKHLDGIEVFNGNPRHNNNNPKALKWAQKHSMIETAGSDFHEHGDASAGIFMSECPSSINKFVEIIKSGDYEIKT